MAYIPRQKRKKYNPKPKPKFGNDSFYNSTAWRKKSKAVRQDFIVCPVCEYRPSEMTDHVVGRPLGADFDDENLLPMCHQCHNKKRGMEAHNNKPLVETRNSSIESKLVPIDKFDIIRVLNKKNGNNTSEQGTDNK